MTASRWKGYGSFFSDKITKTTHAVSQIVSSAPTASQLKDSLGKCLSVGQKSLENAKNKIEEIAHSEDVKNFAVSVKQNYEVCQQTVKEGYDQVSAAATKYIGQKNIEKMSQQYVDYKKSISENYAYAQNKIDEFLKSEEIIQLKSVIDGSMDSILSSNLLFEFGLLFVPGTGPLYMTLKSCKYIVAACIFLLSSIKSYHTRKQDKDIHEKIDPYQKDIDKAYSVMSDLNKIFLNIENELKKLNLDEASFVEAKDFEIKKPESRYSDDSHIDTRIFLKSILEGAEKSTWLFYLLQFICGYTPKKNFFNFLKIASFLTIIIATTISSLQKNILKAKNDENLSILQKELKPIFSVMNELQLKISKDQEVKSISLDKPVKENQIESSNYLKVLTDATSKASGFFLLLQGLFPGHDNPEFALCALITLVFGIDSYASVKKQDEIKQSFQDFEYKMQKLNEMTDSMTMLLSDQKEYEAHLKEMNQFKIDFLKKKGLFNEKPLIIEAEIKYSDALIHKV